jgi:hypothetical protein
MEFFGGTGFHAAAGWRDGALVRKAGAIDEYAAACLTRHRYTEDWAE